MASDEKTEESPFADIFNEDETEKNFLSSKPTCFIVFGKPGSGKSTLARNIAQAWKCIRVEALSVLEEHMATDSETGTMLQSLLVSGHSIPEELVTKLILEKLNSPEVSHFGYIVTELPSLSQDARNTLKQVEFVKNLELQPDVIINIKCGDYDLCQRISGQRQHSSTGFIYTRDQWDPEIIESRRKKKKEPHKDGKVEEEEEEEEQEEEEAYMAEMQVVAEILQYLVQRPEDFLENIENTVKLYKEILLHALEEIMAEHSPQYLIELDGNKSPEEQFMTVIDRLKYLNLRRAAIITKLQSTEEEMNDIIDTDELFRTLASYKLIAPRYRWHRSKWARSCPVALKDGNMFSGTADLSVSFLGKMYCLSSDEALKTFSLNPRPHLLPPMPMPPCKIFMFGPEYSGKTTLSSLIAAHFKGKVIDYVKVVQPRFDEAREKLKKDTVHEATITAIKNVKEKLLMDFQSRKREERTFRELQMQYGKKEYEDYMDYKMFKSSEELQSSAEDEAVTQGSQKVSSMDSADQDKTKSETTFDMYTNKDVSTEGSLEEVDENHPEVRLVIEDTLRHTKDMNFEQPFEKQAEILEEVIKEITEDNKERFPGAPKHGGWIVENCPITRDLWLAFIEKGIAPDLVIFLTDAENNGKCLLNRMYMKNKTEIDDKILKRLQDEFEVKKKEEEALRKVKEEESRLEEEKRRLEESANKKPKDVEEPDNEAEEEGEGEDFEAHEESEAPEMQEYTRESLLPEGSEGPELPDVEHEPESVPEPPEDTAVEAETRKKSKGILETEDVSETVVMPEFPEDAYPSVIEMEPFKEELNNYLVTWKHMEQTITDSLVQLFILDISNKTPNELLQKVVETMQRPFQYPAWELNAEDYDEEAEDYQAETEVEEEQEEEEEEEEEGEESIKEKRRHLGDTKHFCPVVLKENFILQPGSTDEAVKYREKIYYFSTIEAKEKFLEHPEDYVAQNEPLKAPPVRICLLGPRGSGKTLCGRKLAENFGVFHIQFDEFLQEKLLLKAERKFGPEFEEDSEEEQAMKQELEELAVQANVKIEEDSAKKQLPDVQFTEEEEAIKLSLTENEPLPPEILDPLLSEWWLKEPIRSTGFILDGFPRYLEEAQFLAERGFFPDAVVVIQVDDQDIFDRLLPAQVQKWKEKQRKKSERKKLIKDMKTKIRDDIVAKRRAELLAERDKKRKGDGASRDDDDFSDEDAEEEEDIENILEEEFPKDEEEMSEEDEEQEGDATERLRSELGEKFESDINNLQSIQDEFDKFLIPVITINGARKLHIVQYTLNLKLKPLVENRASIFEKCYPVTTHLAHKMLAFTYKYMSSFGYWDPVKLSEGETIKPVENPENPFNPVIHRQYIYFLSSKQTKEKFMMNPIKYIRQPKPKATMPVRIMIVGPPKSGKTTVAKKLASEYGLKRLSVGDALRGLLNNHPDSELSLMLNWHLHKGLTVPDELAIQALDVSLLESTCNTIGVVIDGYPVTPPQMNLLETRSIIPMIIFELDVPSKEIFKRLLLEKKTEQSMPYPLHNSTQIIAYKNAKYRKNVDEIRQFYQQQHQNWHVIDGFHSKWWVWNEIIKDIQQMNKYIQTYMEKIKEGKAACIDKLCITPEELISRLGEFGQFCPVSLAETYELIDCSTTNSLEFAAEFRGHYYKMSSLENLNKFLKNPELYVPPLAPYPLPPTDMLPKRLTLSELKSRFPKCAELQGYCPVTYQDGKQRYEALVPGKIQYAAEYRDRIFIFESEEKLQKFLRLPMQYWDQKLPHKLPPLKEPIYLTSLPLPGYLEQGTATSLIKAMNAAGNLKPKFPFLSVRRSVLLYVAFHLKAFNPKGSEYSRKKYKKKMEQFVERCELITYLSAKMTRKYKEPQFRAIDFDHKMQAFFSLRNIDPVTE